MEYLKIDYGSDSYHVPVKETLDIITQNIKNTLFPIGKIEIFFDNDDHSSYLGFTWERCLIGRTPVGIDSNDADGDFDTIGNQIGEKRHVLTISEMPSHGHTISLGGTLLGIGGWPATTNNSTDREHDTQWTGGDESHNNIQPSEVVAFWKRVS